MFKKFVAVACITIVLASGCSRQEETQPRERDWIDDAIDGLVTQLEEEGIYQPQDSSHDRYVRDELKKRFREQFEESKEAFVNDDRTLMQRQLDSLNEHAPDLSDVLISAGFEQMRPVAKYRTLVPLLREQRWGMDDSSHVVDTLNRIEQLMSTTSDTLVIRYVDRVVSTGINKLLAHFVEELQGTAWLEEHIQSIEKYAVAFPDVTSAFFTCTNGARIDRAKCFSRCENAYFESEIVGIVNVLEKPEENAEEMRKWRGTYSREARNRIDEQLTNCRTPYWDAVVMCYDALDKEV